MEEHPNPYAPPEIDPQRPPASPNTSTPDTFRYTFVADDAFFIEAFEQHWALSSVRWIRRLFYAVGVFALFGSLSITALQDVRLLAEQWPLTILTVTFLAILLFRRRLNRYWMLRQIRKSPSLNDSIEINVLPDGLAETSSSSKAELDWSAFSRVIGLPNGILLYQGPHLFRWLPDRSLVHGEAQQVRSFLSERVKG